MTFPRSATVFTFRSSDVSFLFFLHRCSPRQAFLALPKKRATRDEAEKAMNSTEWSRTVKLECKMPLYWEHF